MDNQDGKVVLTGEEAIEKFLAGKEVWNDYVKKYPEADVDFSGVDFSKYRETGTGFDFSSYFFLRKEMWISRVVSLVWGMCFHVR